ncbi:hypothetical protein E3N88_15534 [Mikania micrantha]|uniref:Uncharacterized protein n=1 Tax=Mikania micrantha TaxID=192012 RepID=A0A5N6NVW5_9ASTR|nr:hypothetical protein E3N88_15534 [Mikania micrantha]
MFGDHSGDLIPMQTSLGDPSGSQGVPGVVKPIPEVPVTTHRISRFAPPICDAEIPKRFQTPTMKLYDGTTDPEEHVAQYRERMETNPIHVTSVPEPYRNSDLKQ